jgi:hypothetical protein
LEITNGADFQVWLRSLPKGIQSHAARILDTGTAAEVVLLLNLYKRQHRLREIAHTE